MPSVLFLTPEPLVKKMSNLPAESSDKRWRLEPEQLTKAFNLVCAPPTKRRTIFQRLTLDAYDPEAAGSGTKISGVTRSLDVVFNGTGGQRDELDAALFDIIVVVKPKPGGKAKKGLYDECEMWTSTAGANMKTAEQLKCKTIPWLARPGAAVVFVGEKVNEWSMYTKCSPEWGTCPGRDVRAFDMADGNYDQELWRAIMDAALAVTGDMLPSKSAVPEAIKAAPAHLGEFGSSSSSNKDQPVSLLPIFPLPRTLSTTPSIFVHHRNSNRGSTYVCSVLQGIVTAGMVFEVVAFPSRGCFFVIEDARDGGSYSGMSSGDRNMMKCCEEVLKFPLLAGDMFVCHLDVAPGFAGSAQDRAINVTSGTALKAIPWPEQPKQQRIFDQVFDGVIAPRTLEQHFLRWREGHRGGSGDDQQQQEQQRRNFDAWCTPERKAAVAAQKQKQLSSISSAADFIFKFPSDIHNINSLHLKPIFPRFFSADPALQNIPAMSRASFNRHVAGLTAPGKIIHSGGTGGSALQVHTASGTCMMHHSEGVVEEFSPAVQAEILRKKTVAGKEEKEEEQNASNDPDQPTPNLRLFEYSGNDYPDYMTYFGGVSSAALTPGSTITQGRNPGTIVFFTANQLCVPHGAAGNKEPIICRVLDFGPVEDIFPSEFFTGGGDSSLDFAKLSNTADPWAATVVNPADLFTGKATLPSGPEAAAARNHRASLIMQQPWVSTIVLDEDQDALIRLLSCRQLLPPTCAVPAAVARLQRRWLFEAPAAGESSGAATATATAAEVTYSSASSLPSRALAAWHQQPPMASFVEWNKTTKSCSCPPIKSSKRYEQRHTMPPAAVVAPCLLEWALGVWLPPLPQNIKGRLAQWVWSKKAVPMLLGELNKVLAEDSVIWKKQQQQQQKDDKSSPSSSSSSSPCSALLQLFYKVLKECSFDEQMLPCSPIGARVSRMPLALSARQSYLCFLPKSFFPNFEVAIDSISKEKVKGMLELAQVAARAGNLDLAGAIASQLLAGACLPSGALKEIFTTRPPSSLPLFAAVNLVEYAKPPVRFFPALSVEGRSQQDTLMNDKNTARKAFPLTLDAVLVSLATSQRAIADEAFAATLTHVAFAMTRIAFSTLKERSGVQWKTAGGFVNQAASATRCLKATTEIEKKNLRLLRDVFCVVGTQTMRWGGPMAAGGRQLCGMGSVPASVAVVAAFLHRLLAWRVQQRVAAEQSYANCDPSFLTLGVLEMLVEMPK